MSSDMASNSTNEAQFLPPRPGSVEETRLRLAFLADLTIKILYSRGYIAGADIAEQLAYLPHEQHNKPGKPLRACHPRDLLDEIVDITRYKNMQPTLTKDMIDRACRAHFVEL